MANEVKIVVTSKNESKPGLADVTKDVESFSAKSITAVARVSPEFKRLDTSIHNSKMQLKDLSFQFANTDDAAKKLDIGKSMRKLESDIQAAARAQKYLTKNVQEFSTKSITSVKDLEPHFAQLNNVIDTSTVKLKQLTLQLALTDDESQKMDLSKSIRKLETDISHASKTKKNLSSMFDFTPDPSFVKKLTSSIGSALAQASAVAPEIIGAAIALSAPFIGATLAGAVVGGAGLGGLVGGAILAAKDPRIKSAGASLGKQLLGDLQTSATNEFVDPMVRGINKVRSAWKTIKPDIDDIFSDSAQFVDPIIDGTLSGVKKLVAGVKNAVHQAGPVINEIGRFIDQTGGAVGDFFTEMSKHAEEGALAIHDITDATVAVITVTGQFAGGLAEVYGWFSKINDKVREITGNNLFELATKSTSPLISLFSEVGSALNLMGDDSKGAKKAVDATTTAVERQTAALDQLSKELHAQQDPVFGLLSAQEKLADAQTAARKATEKHGAASKEAKAALRLLAVAALDVQGRSEALGESFNGKMTPALRNSLSAAGLTAKQIKELGKQFREAKGDGDRFAKTYRAKMVFSTFGRPFSDYTGIGGSSARGLAHGGIVGAADGGNKSGSIWVGEHGPELATLPPGTNIKSNPDSMRATKASMSGDGTMQLILRVSPTADPFMTALMKALRAEIRDGGGNVQTVLGVVGA